MPKKFDPEDALQRAQRQLDDRARKTENDKARNKVKQADLTRQLAALEQKLEKLKRHESQLNAEQAQHKHRAQAIQLKTVEVRLTADRDAWEKKAHERPKSAKRNANFTLEPPPKAKKQAPVKEVGRSGPSSDLGSLIDAMSPFQDKRPDKKAPIRESKTYSPAMETTPRDNTKWTRRADTERKRAR